MTLFEAIRELKEGQYINIIADVGCFCGVYAWEWGEAAPKCVLDEESWGLIKGWTNPKVFTDTNVRIYALPKPSPKPKMSLEEGLEKVERDVFVEVAETDTSTVLYALWSKRPSISKAILSKLRSLPIDWQAEADRKEAK